MSVPDPGSLIDLIYSNFNESRRNLAKAHQDEGQFVLYIAIQQTTVTCFVAPWSSIIVAGCVTFIPLGEYTKGEFTITMNRNAAPGFTFNV